MAVQDAERTYPAGLADAEWALLKLIILTRAAFQKPPCQRWRHLWHGDPRWLDGQAYTLSACRSSSLEFSGKRCQCCLFKCWRLTRYRLMRYRAQKLGLGLNGGDFRPGTLHPVGD